MVFLFCLLFILHSLTILVGKIAEKVVCIFDNVALYFEYRINKNTLQIRFYYYHFNPLK